jgi:hypothetical protein
MNGNRRTAAIGMMLLVAGVGACADSPTGPGAFGVTSQPRVVAVLVQNATAFDLHVSAELGRDAPGAGVAGEVIVLGTVRAGAQEEFILEPLMLAALPVRFIARSEIDGPAVESDWMWLRRGTTVGLLATPTGLVRTDGPEGEPPEDCPAPQYEGCF